MRLGWYAGASTALAGTVVLSAFYQRANFYSAMVYLAQSNFCLLVLVNFSLLLYSSFVYGLTRVFFGPLRAVEVEQLTERAWFAITETCLAMTIFREEIGAWFLVMFAALVTGKVWGWIGDGRVEVLEQQPPANPRLFHLRLSVSLLLSLVYDIFILHYTVNTVIQQARPNMMVMFLFEFAVLTTCSGRTTVRYALSLFEHYIQEKQKRDRLAERRREVREEREAIQRRREAAAAAGEEVSDEPLPNEDDIDEMDIEVPGWSYKGECVLWLDLICDMIKLGIYIAFFFMLLTFYGLPIHIMRDLFMTSRDFVKRLGALLRYRKAIQEMNRYPDATQEELAREDTCIICREEMRPWDPENNPGAIDRVRPKKLPCGHILHLGCLKSWLERQQVCPTCRSPVTLNENARAAQNRAAGLRIEIGGGRPADQQPPVNAGDVPAQGQQNGDGARPERRQGGPRIFNFGPLRVGFGANGQQVRELAQQFGMPQGALNQGLAPPTPAAATPTPTAAGQTGPASPQPLTGDNTQTIGTLLQQADQMIQRELQSLQVAQQELQTIHLLQAELHRLRLRQHLQDQPQNAQIQTAASPAMAIPQPPLIPQHHHYQVPPQVAVTQPSGFPSFPAIPPRNPSPFMARHGAPPSTVPIPAGSAELPDGVVIPPGWSLLPLQRLEGGNSTQPSPQAGPQTTGTEGSGAPQPAHTAARQPSPSGSGSNEAQPSDNVSSAASAEPAIPRTSQTSQFMSQFTRAVEPPPVVAPSPRMPNWGGSAQLFGNGSRLDHADTPQHESQPEVPGRGAPVEEASQSSHPAVEPQSQTQQDDSSSQSSDSDDTPEIAPAKGKARAVTVEEVDDEEDMKSNGDSKDRTHED
ncbi:hypothetical protein FDECE_1972 [Fusarium decemcellulare]|nr:hypothetical protein FDECE_1972 [Fusarium decemcellulare]